VKYLVLLACLWLVCCGQANQRVALFEEHVENDSIPVIDLSDLDLNQVPLFSDIYDSISFVKLETRDDAFIGDINKIIAVDGKFIIMDADQAQSVLVFDDKGRFLNRIGRNGRGPQEYEYPSDITYDKYNDEIIINNNNRQMLMFFKLDGTFVKEIPLNFYFGALNVIDSNTIAIYRNNRGNGEDDYNLVLIDREGNVKNQFLPIDRATDLLSASCEMAFFLYGDTLQFSPPYSRIIYALNEDGLLPRYRVNFGDRNIPYRLLKGETSRDINQEIRDSRNYMYISAYAETTDHLAFRFVYYNGLAYDCYYSKTSGKYIAGAFFINDMYGADTSGRFYCVDNNLLVSVIKSGAFIGLQSSLAEIEKRKSSLQKMNIEALNSVKTNAVFNDKLIRNMIKAWESADVTLSQEEIDFINSVDESDNPVLRIARLKKF
jgi:hypothetical protein